MKTKTIHQSVIIKANPHEIYEMLMDSEKHSRMIGDEAKISREIGGRVSAWGDYVDGVNLELVPDRKIVQKWRASDWPSGHYSTATFELQETEDATELVFTQKDVPEDFCEGISQGWWDYYWTPMKETLE